MLQSSSTDSSSHKMTTHSKDTSTPVRSRRGLEMKEGTKRKRSSQTKITPQHTEKETELQEKNPEEKETKVPKRKRIKKDSQEEPKKPRSRKK